jgi:hypothetical protein
MGVIAALTALWFVAPDLGRPWLGGAAVLGLGPAAGELNAHSPWVWDLLGVALSLAIGFALLCAPREGLLRECLVRAAVPLLVCGNSAMACGLSVPAGVVWHAAILAPASLVTGARIAMALVLGMGGAVAGGSGTGGRRHQAALATWIAVTGAVTAIAYGAEWLSLALGGPREAAAVHALFRSEMGPVLRALPILNCAIPLLLAWPRLRGVRACVVGVCAVSLVGGWLEALVAATSFGGALPSTWGADHPSVVEWVCTLAAALFLGSLVWIAVGDKQAPEDTADAATGPSELRPR